VCLAFINCLCVSSSITVTAILLCKHIKKNEFLHFLTLFFLKQWFKQEKKQIRILNVTNKATFKMENAFFRQRSDILQQGKKD
jgi:hypothetical protein